ncbi:redoxin domain-containing protein [Dyadobacter sp. LJ53]|uniref:redoxin domain-containing protein n=1 Tax=Dyadobacter chenwenxiniae TaxID=2906456 RepID=UPI001F1C88C2|nr:redoxin domain-containing protein [Dyadobacter chenwenxiniae]MCF0049374.1 redoxin domain-containing protein [Dyadobacter chenwenxiniae]
MWRKICLLLLALNVFFIENTASKSVRETFQAETLKVVLFLDPECPVTNAYMKEIKSIHADYSGKGVIFEAYFPMETIADKDIKVFLKKYNATFPGFTDPELRKAKRYKATVMPEVILLDADGITVYQGAIDNWFYALGKSRPKATELYLRNAIEATLNGNPVMQTKTQAIGCLINMKLE